MEVAARDARYTFFEAARRRFGADAVAVAHTRDDQAETVLLRLLRGTGTRGLRAALPARGGVVRPLLGCGRDELRAYLERRGARWVEDETNADTSLLRNRIRHDLLPRLVRDYQPAAPRILARTAEVAHDEDAYMTAQARAAWAEVVAPRPGAGGSTRVRSAACRPLSAVASCGWRWRRRGPAAASGWPMSTACSPCAGTRSRLPAASAGVVVERFSTDAVLMSRGAEPAPEPIPPAPSKCLDPWTSPSAGPDGGFAPKGRYNGRRPVSRRGTAS